MPRELNGYTIDARDEVEALQCFSEGNPYVH